MFVLRRFRHDKKGLAAVEFALILPALILLLFGIAETSQAVTARTDVSNLASVAADLVAQAKTLSSTDMGNVFNASSVVLYPYSLTPSGVAPLKITIFSVIDNGTPTGKIAWGCQKTGTQPAVAVNGPMPAGANGGTLIAQANPDKYGNPQYGGPGSVILVQVVYNYVSPTMQVIKTAIPMNATFYSKPRRVAQIAQPPACS